jgi:hypothetical protein
VDKAAENSCPVSTRNDHLSFFGGVLEMMWRWRYFIGSVLLTAFFLISYGAPPAAVAAGVVGVAMFMWRRGRASRLD